MLLGKTRSHIFQPALSFALYATLLALAAHPFLFARNTPRAVNLSLKTLEGKRISLRDLRGKIVVLNFWATWCGPCNAEMPLLIAAEQQYRNQDVVFLGASLDDPSTQKNVPAFLDLHHVVYSIGIGATTNDLRELQMGIAVPATAFIDRNGVIRARISGQMRPQELQQRIDWLLRDETGLAPSAVVTHLDEK